MIITTKLIVINAGFVFQSHEVIELTVDFCNRIDSTVPTQQSYTLKMKRASPQCLASVYPIRWPKDLSLSLSFSLEHDWIEFAKVCLFVAKVVCQKKGGVQPFWANPNEERHLRQSDWTKKKRRGRRALRRNQLRFLESISYVFSLFLHTTTLFFLRTQK